MSTHAWADATDRQKTTAVLIAVLVMAILPYLNALGNGFAFDDTFIIQTNARVHDLRAWRDIWLAPYWPALGRELGLYRPLTVFLFAVQWAVGHGARWPFHLVNILLHATASVLVLLLLMRIGMRRIPAAIGALVFAVHPVHTEAVANMVGQAELTTTCLLLAACLVYAGRPDGIELDWRRRITIVLLYAIALLAKESAVVLPGLLVLLDFVQRRVTLTARGFKDYVSAAAFPILSLVCVLLIYLSIRYQALGGTLTGIDAGPSMPALKEHHLLNALRGFPEYLRLLVWPADLTVDYVPATVFFVTTLTVMSAIGLILVAGMTALMIATPWAPALGAAPAWFLISISPVSNIFFPIGVLVAERTLYLPSVALSILLGYLVTHVIKTGRARDLRVGGAVVVLALGAMMIRTWIRNPDWKNSSAVQNAVFRDHPESYHSQWGRALVSWDNGKLDEAGQWFALAHRTYPRDSGMLATYASFLMAVGEDDLALPLVKQPREMHPFMPNSTALLAFLYLTTKQYDSAQSVVVAAERLGLPLAMTMGMRAYIYQGQGRMPEAVAAWRVVATRMTTGNAIAYAYLGRALAYAGRQDEAHEAIAKGIAASKDSVFRQLLTTTDSLISDNCYKPAEASRNGDLYGPPNLPACDRLGSWFDRATLLQGATFSQFAIPRRLITSMRVRTRLPKPLPDKHLPE